MVKKMRVIAGLDIGNGYVKGKALVGSASRDLYTAYDNKTLKPIKLDCPSVVAYSTGSNLPMVPTHNYVADLLNQLDVTITSSALKSRDDSKRMFVGTRAVTQGDAQITFDINSPAPKCDESLSIQLIASAITSAAIEEYFFEHENLNTGGGLVGETAADTSSNNNESAREGMDAFFESDTTSDKLPYSGLEIDVVLGVNLPISDYRDYKDSYIEKLERAPITTVVHNFEQPITCTIRFVDVAVMPEGAAGSYAIATLEQSHHGFLDQILLRARGDIDEMIAEQKKRGEKVTLTNISEEYSGQILANAKNSISVDIGEGTVNFPVFKETAHASRISIEDSKSINVGYGSVLQRLMDQMHGSDLQFGSRKDLADFLLPPDGPVSPVQRNMRRMLAAQLKPELEIFANTIISTYTQIFRTVGARTEVVYVYGGGSTPMRDVLYPLLVEASTINGFAIPVLYMRSVDSRDLNRNGLFDGAMSLARRSFRYDNFE